MKKRRAFWLLVCFSLLVSLLAGCGSSDVSSDDEADSGPKTEKVSVLNTVNVYWLDSDHEYTDFETDELGRVTGLEKSGTATFEYDDDGRMVLYNHSRGGDKSEVETITYDDAKNTFKVVAEVNGAINRTPRDSTYQFSDEENGNPTKVAISSLIHDEELGDYNESDYLELHYNDDGRIDGVKYYIHGGKFDHTEELEYDEDGNLTEWTFKDENGETYLAYSFEYTVKEIPAGKLPELSAFQSYFNIHEIAMALL